MADSSSTSIVQLDTLRKKEGLDPESLRLAKSYMRDKAGSSKLLGQVLIQHPHLFGCKALTKQDRDGLKKYLVDGGCYDAFKKEHPVFVCFKTDNDLRTAFVVEDDVLYILQPGTHGTNANEQMLFPDFDEQWDKVEIILANLLKEEKLVDGEVITDQIAETVHVYMKVLRLREQERSPHLIPPAIYCHNDAFLLLFADGKVSENITLRVLLMLHEGQTAADQREQLELSGLSDQARRQAAASSEDASGGNSGSTDSVIKHMSDNQVKQAVGQSAQQAKQAVGQSAQLVESNANALKTIQEMYGVNLAPAPAPAVAAPAPAVAAPAPEAMVCPKVGNVPPVGWDEDLFNLGKKLGAKVRIVAYPKDGKVIAVAQVETVHPNEQLSWKDIGMTGSRKVCSWCLKALISNNVRCKHAWNGTVAVQAAHRDRDGHLDVKCYDNAGALIP